MKLSNKLSFSILITGMIVLILLSFTIYKISYNSIMKSQFMYTKSIADEVSDDIDQLLNEKVKTAMTLANTTIIKNALEKSNLSYANLPDEKRKTSIKLQNEKWKSTKDPTDNFILKFTDNNVSHFLRNQQALLKGEYGEIFLTNKFGALIASTSKLSTLAHGHKYWWIGSYDNGEGAVFFDDRGYDDSVGGYVLGLVVPIRKGNEIIGILKCNLNILGGISELISGAEDKLIGKFKLTRSGGMVVFEEGFEPLSTQIHDSIYKKLKDKNNESFIINDSGEKYLVGFSEINLTKGEKGYGFGGTFESIDHKKGNTGESWYVLCYRQMSVVLAPITESVKAIILTGSAMILILVLVSYLFGRKIAKPITILDKATEKIGKGDFEYRIDIKRNDEFGNLGDSFNSMASKLKQTTTTVELLENEVKRRKQIEKDLRRSEESYRELVENAVLGIFQVTKEGKFLMANQRMVNICGYDSQQDFFGDVDNIIKLYVNPEERSGVLKEIDEEGHLHGREMNFKRKDGNLIFCNAYVRLVQRKDGENVYEGLLEDITDKKKMEAQLQQAQKMKSIGTLAGGIAHNFNNLLMGIQGNASIMFLDIDSSHPRHKNLKSIEKLVENGAKLTAQLIGYAREGSYQVKPISLNQLVKETSDTFGMTKKEITVHQELSEKLYGIKADQGQMEQVLLNLYVNSADAMPGGGDLFLKTINVTDKDITGKLYEVQPGNYVFLSVRDTGGGMDKETRERIFEPFFTTKGLASATGLGMPSAYGTIKGHGGYIDVDSEKGKGTTFNIYLPATEKMIEEKKVLSDELVTGKGTVLLVDDEEMVLEAGEVLLNHLGYEVLLAENGREALELYKKNQDKIDLVLLDMVMPVMGGGEAFDRMKEINTNVKVLLSSGYSLEGEAKEILKRGCDAFIQKPFKMEQLSQKLREILDEK